MNLTVCSKNNISYVETKRGCMFIYDGSDMADVIGVCGSNGTNRILIHGSCLDSSYYDLKTGTAGEILQKLSNYFMKAAIVLPLDLDPHHHFREMVNESNRAGDIVYFSEYNNALDWLLS